jgi:hypothetical protein
VASESRRTFLKKGLLGGALLACAGLGLSLWPTRRIAPRRPLVMLDELELSIFASIAEAMSPGADAIEIAHRVDALIVAQSATPRHDLGRLLRLLENGLVGALLDARPRPFTRSSIEARAAALRAMRDSRLAVRRSGYQVLRRLVQSARFTDPAAWAEFGYAGPPQLAGPTLPPSTPSDEAPRQGQPTLPFSTPSGEARRRGPT